MLEAKIYLATIIENVLLKFNIFLKKEQIENSINTSKFADLSSSILFLIVKKKSKEQIEEIKKTLKSKVGNSWFFSSADFTGLYFNLNFTNEYLYKIIARAIDNNLLFKKQNKKIFIEFPSVNPNKPWHIGHLRNALIGHSLANLLSFVGNNVIRLDYIDDLGLQVAESVWSEISQPQEPNEKYDFYLGKKYIKVSKEFEENEDVKKSVLEVLEKIEKRDAEMYPKAREIVEKCVKAQYETAHNFNIFHHYLIFESDIISTFFNKGLELLKQNKALKFEQSGKNKGCYVIPLSQDKNFENLLEADKILIRSNGTATYTAKDIIFHLWKFGIIKFDFKFSDFLQEPFIQKSSKKSDLQGQQLSLGNADICVNIIGTEQTYPQKIIKKVLKDLGFPKQANSLIHIAYAHAELEGKKISGRKGTWQGFTADEILKNAFDLALKNVKKDYNEKEKIDIAKKVSLAAIYFAFLHVNFDKKIIYKEQEALRFEGETGPYLQYTYARQSSILRKVDFKLSENNKYEFDKIERQLIKKISEFSCIIDRCVSSYRISPLTDYLIDLAQLFNVFYVNNQILVEDQSVKNARLSLLVATHQTLKLGLQILGIPILDKM